MEQLETKILFEHIQQKGVLQYQNTILRKYGLFAISVLNEFLKEYKLSFNNRKKYFSACYLGLLRAAAKYDLNKGFSFTTYSKWWIKCYLINEFYKQETLFPRYSKKNKGKTFISIYLKDEYGIALEDKLTDEKEEDLLNELSNKKLLNKLIKKARLTENEKKIGLEVIKNFYFNEIDFRIQKENYSITTSRILQLKDQTLKKLKNSSTTNNLIYLY